MFPSRPHGLILVGLGLLSASACSSEDLPPLGQRPLIEGQLDRSMTFVEVGTTLTVEIDIVEEDGSLPPIRWIWDTPESDNYLLSETLEAGHLTVSFSPRVPGRMLLSGRAELDRADGRTEVVGINVADVRAFGGAPNHPLPAHARLQMLVGESRSTFAFAFVDALGSASNRSLGADSASYAVDNESVATVDASGHVHALAAGTTRLTMAYGGQSKSIPIEVKAGKLGDPDLGAISIDTDFAPILRRAFQRSSTEGRMTTNRKGWPVMALVLDAMADEVQAGGGESLGGQVVLAEWTGSGWGLEIVSRPFDYADDAQLAIDANDLPYVLYSSKFVRSSALHAQDSSDESSFVLAGRSGPDSAWQHHALPHGQDADEGRDRLGDFGKARSLRPRSGGGVWAAYTSSGTRYQDGELQCIDGLQLAQLNGSALTLHVVAERAVALSLEASGECPNLEAANAGGVDMMLDILPRVGDQELPSVLSAHPWDVNCQLSDIRCALPVNRFTPGASGFTRSNVLETFDFDQARDNSRFTYQHLSALRDPGLFSQSSSILIGLEANDVSSQVSRTIVVNQEGATWFQSPKSDITFGFRQDGLAYVGDASLETMHIVGPSGLVSSDAREPNFDKSIPVAEVGSRFDAARGEVVAWAASRQRLYLVQDGDDGLLLHSSLMPLRSVATTD